ncbi:MAG: tRNA threonylcarbamoyladenosine biosynthesis protein TsaE [Luteibaculaceae bacterium]|jgi:tRNA threonylcarbamoyladenosine biosynthesis protein TsaE
MKARKVILKSLEDTQALAKEIANELKGKQRGVIPFFGEMGAGKTTLIRSIIEEMQENGGDVEVTSPTYSLVNEYELNGVQVAHFDFYRLNDPMEAYDFGVEEYLDGPWLCFMEWPEKIEGIPYDADFSFFLEVDEQGHRTFEVRA